jgi:hypothetical protein
VEKDLVTARTENANVLMDLMELHATVKAALTNALDMESAHLDPTLACVDAPVMEVTLVKTVLHACAQREMIH